MNAKQKFDRHYNKLFTEAILKSFTVGAGSAFAVNLICAFIYWMFDIGNIIFGISVGILSGAVTGIAMYFKRYRVTEQKFAQRLDRYGLQERLITMLELEGADSDIAKLQREDASDKLSALPVEKIKFKISPLLSAIVGATASLSILVSVLGILAYNGKLPYGKDIFAQGVDGTFEITYTVEGGGSILGERKQSVAFGDSTSAVRAIADDGWMFVGWDDGTKSPERAEENIRCDAIIKAVFKKINSDLPDEDDSDAADDLPYGSVTEDSGGGNSDDLGGDNIRDDGEGSGGGKWQDRNQFIDGATYYRDYLEYYYQYATGIFESDPDIPDEIIEFFETYFSGI